MSARYGSRTKVSKTVPSFGKSPGPIPFSASWTPGPSATLTDLGTHKIITFTASSTVTFGGSESRDVDYLVIAGGGGGGPASSPTPGTVQAVGGGGGNGGFISGTLPSVSPTVSYTITVGSGGAANANGNDSTFGPITAIGGGAGGIGGPTSAPVYNGSPGGCGGGGGARRWVGNPNLVGTGGTGSQGSNGGNGTQGSSTATPLSPSYQYANGGDGGYNLPGYSFILINSQVDQGSLFRGGGGGAANTWSIPPGPTITPSVPGMGASFAQAVLTTSVRSNSTAGLANRGGGGGGGSAGSPNGSDPTGSAGGSGTVIIRWAV